MMKLMPQKFLVNGILGYTLQAIKLKTYTNLKNLNGRNHTSLIKQALKKLTIQINKIMQTKKNIKLGKIKIVINFIFLIFFCINSHASQKNKNLEGTFVEIKVLDKVSSKNSQLILKIGEEKKFQNLMIKTLKCKNSEFDDNPEITAYLQVRDVTYKENDKVFVFNGWTFSSSPSLRPFEHPVYDIWLVKCY